MAKNTRKVRIGNVVVGGGEPVRIQSMCSTDTSDIRATVKQIKQLESAGCEIIRVAVPNKKAVQALRTIKQSIKIPLVADIHFDYRLALASIRQGVDKIRINPGTIGSKKNIKEIIAACKDHNVAVRIGVNAGSLIFLKKSDAWRTMNTHERAQQMVREALGFIDLVASYDFHNIVVSLKAADIDTTVSAYRQVSTKTPYPLHLGITEAGTLIPGIVKSTIAFGGLLSKGIGDTIRVSLTDDPVYEVKAAKEILRALNMRSFGPEIISCPTCARCKINITRVVNQLEQAIDTLNVHQAMRKPIKIAVMGCAVNGPGEARDADIGIAGSNGMGILFKHGKAIKKVPEKQWVKEILKEIIN